MYLMSENGQKKPSSIAPPLLYCSCKVNMYKHFYGFTISSRAGLSLSSSNSMYFTVLIGLFFLQYTLKFINCLPNREFTV